MIKCVHFRMVHTFNDKITVWPSLCSKSGGGREILVLYLKVCFNGIAVFLIVRQFSVNNWVENVN